MNADPKYARRFWLTFGSLFVATSFIPVLPLYTGYDPVMPLYQGANTEERTLFAMLPIWAVYLCVLFPHNWILFTGPVVVTHATMSYLFAKRFADSWEQPIRFSVRSLLSATVVFSIGISLISRHSHVGFSVFFFVCMTVLVIANIAKLESIAAIPVPKMNLMILILCAVICTIMGLFGLPVLFAEMAR